MAKVELFDAPIERTLGDLTKDPLISVLCGGIVNPFGPTLSAIVAVAQRQPNYTYPLFHLMLNPFRRSAMWIGHGHFADIRWLASDAQPLLDVPFGACPSFFLPSKLFDEQQALEVHARWIARLEGARKTWEQINAFPGNPQARVNAEIADSVTRLRFVAGTMSAGTLSYDAPEDERASIPLDAREALRFAAYALSGEHMAAELVALSAAWSQAVQLRRDVDGSMRQSTMDAEAYRKWLLAIATTCRFASTDSQR